MFTQLFLKNKDYIVSKRDYTFDYSNEKIRKIDMTLSGKYLSNYNLKIDTFILDEYPSKEDINRLINEIKKYEKNNREVIIGSGANGILQNIIKMIFINKGNLVTPFYTFDEAEFAVTSFNGYTKRVYLNKYKVDFNKLYKAIDKKTKMVYICNPNNPTGIYADSKEIIEFSKKIKIPVVVDESGIEFTNEKSILSYNDLPDNILVIHSFSKAYGLANLRIGYLVCTKEFKELYTKRNTINEISGIATIFAIDQLQNKINIRKNISKIIFEREKIITNLENIGIKCIKSDSNIIMTDTHFDKCFIDKLEKNDIGVVLVYDEKNNIHIRIAVQDEYTNDEFIKIIKNIYK